MSYSVLTTVLLLTLAVCTLSQLHCPFGLSTDGKMPRKTVMDCDCCYRQNFQMTVGNNTLYNCLEKPACGKVTSARESTVCERKVKRITVLGQSVSRVVDECWSKNVDFY